MSKLRRLSLGIITIIAISLSLPLQGFSGEQLTGDKPSGADKGIVPGSDKAIGVDIKKMAKPIKPNIPDKYRSFIDTEFSTYWSERKLRNFKKSYDLEGSDYRAKTSRDLYEFKMNKAANIIAVRPLEVRQINEKEVIVRASIGFKGGPIDTVRFMQDQWMLESAGWRHVPSKDF